MFLNLSHSQTHTDIQFMQHQLKGIVALNLFTLFCNHKNLPGSLTHDLNGLTTSSIFFHEVFEFHENFSSRMPRIYSAPSPNMQNENGAYLLNGTVHICWMCRMKKCMTKLAEILDFHRSFKDFLYTLLKINLASLSGINTIRKGRNKMYSCSLN